jgi:hypothetical protein
VRWLAFVGIASLLGGCTARDPYVSTANTTSSGEWKIERQLDRITGNAITSALLWTRNSSHSGEDYAKPAQMQLMCFESKPVVRFVFEFKIGSDKNSSLGYRFDDKPGRDNVESRVLLGYQIIVIEDKTAVAQFVDELVSSNVLYLRMRTLNAGRTTAEFRVAGAAAAVQAGFAECPVTPLPGQKRTS